MEFKLNIGSPKDKKTYKKEIKDDMCSVFLGKKIGDKIAGDHIDLKGYEFIITGGSDFCGFPMRRDVEGTNRKRILINSGVGIKKKKRKGIRLRKTVAGNTIYEKTVQINLKIVKYGSEPIEPKQEEKTEEKKDN